MEGSRRSFLAAAAAAATAGCVGAVNRGTGSGGSDPEVAEVSLLLNWKPSGLHAPYYAARARGYYEEEGLSLEAIESGQGSDFSATQAGLGNAAFAVTSSDQVLKVNSQELSPRSVAVVMQRSPVVLFAAREHFGGPLEAASQLEGATVGTGPGMVRLLTELFLERADVLRSVELVNTGFDTVQQLLAGKVDAAGGVFGDVVDARHHDYAVDLLPVASAIPAYGHVIATSADFAAENPRTVRAFLRATARGSAWAHRNPAAATDELVEAVPALAESRGRQRDKWGLMREGFVLSDAVREHGWGWSEPAPWRTLHDLLGETDALGGGVDPAAVWTNDYLDLDATAVGSYADRVSE